MGTVNKADMVREVAEATGTTTKAAQAAVEALIGSITRHAEAGDTVRFLGFGSFSVKARPPRTGRNPATGEAIAIPETRKLLFKAAKLN